MSGIPLVGFGEISWLAKNTQTPPGTLTKPHAAHAVASILSSLNIDKKVSLKYSNLDPAQWPDEILKIIQGGTISVFEDTPAGVIAIQSAGQVLERAGVDFEIKVFGIAKEKSKKDALKSQGAQIFPDINTALSDLEYFGSFAGD